MSAVVMVRLQPLPGQIGCIGSCPLCSRSGSARPTPPCLACREELRSRLSEMQMGYYVARARN